jgi:hypothetical protein
VIKRPFTSNSFVCTNTLKPRRIPRQWPPRPAGLARSVSHLLTVIEQLAIKGANFRSLHDPIDTTTQQEMFSPQVLCAVAQLGAEGPSTQSCTVAYCTQYRGVGWRRSHPQAPQSRPTSSVCIARSVILSVRPPGLPRAIWHLNNRYRVQG